MPKAARGESTMGIVQRCGYTVRNLLEKYCWYREAGIKETDTDKQSWCTLAELSATQPGSLGKKANTFKAQRV